MHNESHFNITLCVDLFYSLAEKVPLSLAMKKISFFLSVYLLSQVSLSLARVRGAVMLGAPEKMDSDDPYIQAAADFAILEINNQARGKNVRVLVNVKEATTQVSIISEIPLPWYIPELL